jgi:hypothetical protein
MENTNIEWPLKPTDIQVFNIDKCPLVEKLYPRKRNSRQPLERIRQLALSCNECIIGTLREYS